MTIVENDLLGHNQPPSDALILAEQLPELEGELLNRRDELLASVSRAPKEIRDDVTAGRVADLIRLVAACVKAAETRRVGTKEPYLAAGRSVDGFFRGITEPLARAKTDVERKLTLYQREVAEAERRRREEVARQEREEAERQRREAEAAAAAVATEADVDDAISAGELARQREADAIAAQRAAEAKPAELSRQRSDFGAVASLRRFWDVDDLERDKLDLETLRPFLPLDALEKAVRGFVRSGGRELRGCRIFENTATSVR